MTILSVAQGFNPVIASVSDLSAVAQRAKAETTQRRQPFSFRRPGLRAGTHNPGVNCSRRRLPNCRKRESSPYGSRRGGRDDVSGFSDSSNSHVPQHSRDTLRPSFANSFRPKNRGRREDRVRAAPAVSCAKLHVRNAHMSIQVQRKQSGLPCATVLRLIFVLSPARPGLLVTVAPKKRELLKNLTPAIGASGPHDFAVRLTRPSSKALRRPPLPAPTSVTMANAPSLGTGCEQ